MLKQKFELDLDIWIIWQLMFFAMPDLFVTMSSHSQIPAINLVIQC